MNSNSISTFFQNTNSNTVLVTGANRGIGLGFVKHYLKSGFSVVATCRQPKIAEALISLSIKYPNQLLIEELDISKEKSILQFAKRLDNLNLKLYIVISNAGVSIEEDFGQWTYNTFESVLLVNTIGAALFAQAVTPFLIDKAKLVQISSGIGSLKLNINPDGALDAYAVSKASLNMLTVRLASKLLKRKIIVISINPGWVKTDMGGQEAPNTIDDVIPNITLTIENLTLDNSGTFISDEGELIPW